MPGFFKVAWGFPLRINFIFHNKFGVLIAYNDYMTKTIVKERRRSKIYPLSKKQMVVAKTGE